MQAPTSIDTLQMHLGSRITCVFNRYSRAYLAVTTLALPLTASADRLMNIPTGTKILFNRMRTELQLEPTKQHNYRAYLGYGVTREIEAELLLDRFDRRPSILTGDLSYNYLGALTDTVPGLSFGVRDIANRTEDGRQAYIAVTYRMGAESDYNNDVPLELTLGAGTGRRMPLFVGVQIPFTWSFRVLAEHDGNRPRLGFEYLPRPDWAARLQFDDRRTTLSLRWTARF